MTARISGQIPRISENPFQSRNGISVSRISAFEETVAKDIAFGPTNMGKSGAELEKAVNDAARFTGLKDELLENLRSTFRAVKREGRQLQAL